jgi:hypothetical protein
MVPGLYVRHAHLGNSVVPQVVHLAMKTLASAATFAESPSSKADTCETTRNLYEHIRVSGKTSSSCIVKSNLGHLTGYKEVREQHLVFASSSGPIVKLLWATPLHGLTNYYHNLHLFDAGHQKRRLQSLVTQIMNEQKTLDYLAKNSPSSAETSITANPQFTEWLMGYPADWTNTP